MHQFTRLDKGRMPCNLVPIKSGDEIEMGREYVVTISETKHTIPSLGFVVWERRNKLKPEYQGLDGNAIRDLRLGGTAVSAETRTTVLAYLGYSNPKGLDACTAMMEAKILILEMTFVSPEHRKNKIHKFGHMHLDDLVDRKDQFKNELIIAGHVSSRYTAYMVNKMVKKAIPDMLNDRLHLWL